MWQRQDSHSQWWHKLPLTQMAKLMDTHTHTHTHTHTCTHARTLPHAGTYVHIHREVGCQHGISCSPSYFFGQNFLLNLKNANLPDSSRCPFRSACLGKSRITDENSTLSSLSVWDSKSLSPHVATKPFPLPALGSNSKYHQ